VQLQPRKPAKLTHRGALEPPAIIHLVDHDHPLVGIAVFIAQGAQLVVIGVDHQRHARQRGRALAAFFAAPLVGQAQGVAALDGRAAPLAAHQRWQQANLGVAPQRPGNFPGLLLRAHHRNRLAPQAQAGEDRAGDRSPQRHQRQGQHPGEGEDQARIDRRGLVDKGKGGDGHENEAGGNGQPAKFFDRPQPDGRVEPSQPVHQYEHRRQDPEPQVEGPVQPAKQPADGIRQQPGPGQGGQVRDR